MDTYAATVLASFRPSLIGSDGTVSSRSGGPSGDLSICGLSCTHQKARPCRKLTLLPYFTPPVTPTLPFSTSKSTPLPSRRRLWHRPWTRNPRLQSPPRHVRATAGQFIALRPPVHRPPRRAYTLPLFHDARLSLRWNTMLRAGKKHRHPSMLHRSKEAVVVSLPAMC